MSLSAPLASAEAPKDAPRIFRLASSRAAAVCRNLAILVPILAVQAAAHYYLLEKDSAATQYLLVEALSLLSALVGLNIMLPCIALPLCAWLLPLTSLSGGARVLLALLTLASVPMVFLFILELIQPFPALCRLLGLLQKVFALTIGRLLDLIFIPMVWRAEVGKNSNSSDTKHPPPLSPLRASVGVGVAPGSPAQQDAVEGRHAQAPGRYQADAGTSSSAHAPPVYPGARLLKDVRRGLFGRGPMVSLPVYLLKIVYGLQEALLIPVVWLPFIVDPYLSRFFDHQTAGEARSLHLVLHGSGANTGQWLLGRSMIVGLGRHEVTLFPNYLSGFMHTAPVGGIDTVAETLLLPQLAEEIQKLSQGTTVVSLDIFGHSMGADLLVELVHRTSRDPACPPPLQPHSLQFRNLVCLSGPFCGSKLLGWAVKTVPQALVSALSLDQQPRIDFMPGSDKALQLTRYLREEMMGEEMMAEGVKQETFRRLTLFGGGTDFIVTPSSGLACRDAKLSEEQGEHGYYYTETKADVKWIYLEGVGHYSSVAVGHFWHLLGEELFGD